MPKLDFDWKDYFTKEEVTKVKPKPNLSLYLPNYAEACNELAVPISTSYHQGNTVTCVDVEAVANRSNAV